MKIEEDEKYFKSGEIHCICGCFFKYELEDIKKIRFPYNLIVKTIVVCPKCNRITYLD